MEHLLYKKDQNAFVKSLNKLLKIVKDKDEVLLENCLEETVSFTGLSGLFVFGKLKTGLFKKKYEFIKNDSGYLTCFSDNSVLYEFDINKSPVLISKLEKGDCVNFSDIREAKLEEEIFNHLYMQGVKAFALVPVYLSDELVGYIRLDNCIEYVSLDEATLDYLKTFAYIIADFFEHKPNSNNYYSSKRTNAILNASIDAMAVFGRDGIITETNEAYAQRFDKAVDEVIGSCIYNYFTDEVFESRMDNIKAVFDTGVPIKAEDCRNGVWNEYKVFPIKDNNGIVNEVVVCGHNITKRKKLLEKFVNAENRYKALFENMSCCAAVYAAKEDGSDFIFKDFNKAAERQENIDKETVINKSVVELFPEIKEFGLLSVFKRVWETGIPEIFPLKKYKDGRITAWRENYVYKLPSGEIVALYTDLTEAVKAKEKLQKRKKRLELAVQGTDAGLWDWNIKTDKIIYNKKWAEIIGYTPQELGEVAQENWFKLCHKDDLKKINKLIKEHFAGKTDMYECEIRLKHKDGHWVWILDRGKIVERDKNSEPLRMAGTHIDISKQKTAEIERDETLKRTEKILQETILTISSALEIRDKYTVGHQKQVALIAEAIAHKLKFSRKKITALKTAALLHDIGKIYVPDTILSKPDKLTEYEDELMKLHVEKGYEILQHISFSGGVCEIVKQHHERYDGSGYPKGLNDGNILKESSILAIADVVDAMSSDRPYRKAFSINDTLNEIKTNKGVLYDPEAAEACIELFEKDGFKLTNKTNLI